MEGGRKTEKSERNQLWCNPPTTTKKRLSNVEISARFTIAQAKFKMMGNTAITKNSNMTKKKI